MHYPSLNHTKLWLLAIGVGLATFLEVLDLAITNVSLPVIAGDLGVSVFNGTWVISGYAVSNAIMILLAGSLARRFGEVRYFCVSIVLFIIFSSFCGLARNFSALVFFRVCQGASAGALVPLSQSLLLRNSPPNKRAILLGLWSVIFLIAPMIGPVLGGIISDTIGWRWLFYINIPLGIVALVICWSILRHRESERFKTPIDYIGFIFLVIGIGCLQIMLDQGNNFGWFHSARIVMLLIGSLLGITFFIIWTLTAKHPIIDLSLYKIRNFFVGSISVLFTFIVIFSALIIYPIWLETDMNYTAIWAGLAVMPFALLIVIGAPIVELLIHKFKVDLRILLSGSFLIFMISSLMSARYNTQASFLSLLPPRIIIGFALALFFVPGTMIAMSGIDHQRLAQASSLFNFPRILGTGMGASIGVAIMEAKKKIFYDQLMSHITHGNDQVAKIINILRTKGMSEVDSLGWIHDQVVSQATILGINEFYYILAFICLFLVITIWFTKPPFTSSETKVVH